MDTTSKPVPLAQPVIVPVAGVSFRQGVVRALREEERVVVQRDRENEFDENAIAFYTLQGEHFGYLPRKVGEKFLDSPEERWGGVVTDIYPGETWGVRVKITHTNIPQFPVKPKALSYIDPVPADVPETDDCETGQVFSRSGRLLGTAVDYEETAKTVSVQDADGNVKLYPAAAVTVRQEAGIASA